MHTLRIIFEIAILLLALAIVLTVYLQYRKETGTTWQRLLGAAQHSATILWAKFCIVVAGVAGNLDSLADMLGQPEAKDFINAWVGNPKVIAGIMLAIALVTIGARKRTL